MIQVTEFRNRELVFLGKGNYEKYPFNGYQISNSKNYEELQELLKIKGKNIMHMLQSQLITTCQDYH